MNLKSVIKYSAFASSVALPGMAMAIGTTVTNTTPGRAVIKAGTLNVTWTLAGTVRCKAVPLGGTAFSSSVPVDTVNFGIVTADGATPSNAAAAGLDGSNWLEAPNHTGTSYFLNTQLQAYYTGYTGIRGQLEMHTLQSPWQYTKAFAFAGCEVPSDSMYRFVAVTPITVGTAAVGAQYWAPREGTNSGRLGGDLQGTHQRNLLAFQYTQGVHAGDTVSSDCTIGAHFTDEAKVGTYKAKFVYTCTAYYS